MHYSKARSIVDGPASGSPSLTTTYDYDFWTCFPRSTTDAQGRVTTYAPDAAMRLRTTTLPKLASDNDPNPTIETFYAADPRYGNNEGLIYQEKITYREAGAQKIVVTNQWMGWEGP